MASSAMTLSVVATGESSLAGVHVGTSGWSYPSWKPGFYPAGTDSKEFLRFFAERFGELGDRLGPVRVQLISARDEGMIELILGSLDPDFRVAFDLEHPSWDGIEPRL